VLLLRMTRHWNTRLDQLAFKRNVVMRKQVKPKTLNPKLQRPNPKPQTPNPNPQLQHSLLAIALAALALVRRARIITKTR